MLAVYTNSSKHLINWNSPKVGNCALNPFISLYEASIEHGLVVHKVTKELKFTSIHSQKLY